MKSEIFRLVLQSIIIASTLAPMSCIYPKVHLSRSEKKSIPYWRRKSISVFEHGSVRDTVHFYKSGSKYVPNFDHWWLRKTRNDTTSKRGLYYSVVAYSNFPHNKFTDEHLHLIQLRVNFKKEFDKDTLRLSIEDYQESYSLAQYTRDTLTFQYPTDKPCYICVTKVLWTYDRGIIQINKSDGTVWKILSR